MTLGLWLREAAARLCAGGRDAPRLSAELLASLGLGVDRVALIRNAALPLTSEMITRLESLLARRLRGEPTAYILGHREFYGREFAVSPATLIPRPETEHLVEAALSLCPLHALRFADLGTGSGCIAVTLAVERQAWHGVAVDMSTPALTMAHANAATHDAASRLLFVRADMALPLFRPHSLDLLVSNPPYVSAPEYSRLEPEVLHEPRAALMPSSLNSDSPDGLDLLRHVIRHAAHALKPGGWLCLEHGETQAEALEVCFLHNTWSEIRAIQDFSGKNRITIARLSVFSTPQCG